MAGPPRRRSPGPAAANGALAGAIGLSCALLFLDRSNHLPPQPGIWLPALALMCVGGLYGLARHAGLRPTRLDHTLAAVTLTLAALVAVWADPFLYLVNSTAAIVGLGLLAAAFGGKVAPRPLAADLLGQAGRAWRNTLPRLGVDQLLADRAYRRLAAGIAIAVLTAVGYLGLVVVVARGSGAAALGMVAATIGLTVMRYVYGWVDVSLGRAPAGWAADPEAADSAAAGAGRAGSIGWSRAGLLALTAGALALAYACLRGVYLLAFVLPIPSREALEQQLGWCDCGAADPYGAIATVLVSLAVLATLIAVPLAGALADPRRGAATGWPSIGRLTGTVALVAVLLLLATLGTAIVFGLRGAVSETAVAMVRLALVVLAASAACAWRTVTLWLPRWPYAAGAGLIAIGFVVSANLGHPDARVPGLLQPAGPLADWYPGVDGLSEDAVPWIVATLTALDRPAAAGGLARVALLQDLERRQTLSGDPNEARRWYEWNLAAWRADRLTRQLNAGRVSP